jgi:hypothetical protein
MNYERPAVEARRDITAELVQGVQTSTIIGNGLRGTNPTWRHPENTD